MPEVHIVYGAWMSAIGTDKEAIVKLENERFIAMLRTALTKTDGNVDGAMHMIREHLIQELRRTL